MIAPSVHGWSQDIDKRRPVDVDGAKKLLAEAGYPNGFEFTLDCPNNRYVNDEEICQALVGMWAKIGVTAKLNAMPFANLHPEDPELRHERLHARLGRGDLRRAATRCSRCCAPRPPARTGSFNLGPHQRREARRADRRDQDRDRREEARRAMIREALTMTRDKYLLRAAAPPAAAVGDEESVSTVSPGERRALSRSYARID